MAGESVVKEVSAGGLVFREKADGFEMCIVHSLGGTAWQIPKGHTETGETLEQTALREVREETGLHAGIHGPLGTTEYSFHRMTKGRRVRVEKIVHFYLMRFLSGSVNDHDDEVVSAGWLPPDQAMERLTYDNEKQLVAKAMQLLTKK